MVMGFSRVSESCRFFDDHKSATFARRNKRRYGLKNDGTLGWIEAYKISANMSPARDQKLYKPEFTSRVYPFEYVAGVTHIDWLRATCPDTDSVEYILSDFTGLLLETDIQINKIERRHLGYDQAYALTLWYNNNVHIIGHLAYTLHNPETLSPTKGLCLEFTGDGCQYLRDKVLKVWQEIPDLLNYYRMRLTRLDIAWDIPADYAIKHHITVPSIAKNAGSFSSKFSTAALRQNFIGEWGCLLFDGVTPDTYDPSKNAPKGLTINLGARTGTNFFRAYEKGKQLAQLTGDESSVDAYWVRIEQEIKRDKHGNDIPLDAILNPDAFFCYDRPIRQMMLDYASSLNVVQKAGIRNALRTKEKNLLLSKKLYWLKRSYGRTIATLLSTGFTAEDVVSKTVRDGTLKDFIFDLEDDLESCDKI